MNYNVYVYEWSNKKYNTSCSAQNIGEKSTKCIFSITQEIDQWESPFAYLISHSNDALKLKYTCKYFDSIIHMLDEIITIIVFVVNELIN